MDDTLRKAWTGIVTADDYEQHMSAIGQAQAAAELTARLLGAAELGPGSHVVIAGAGTGQLFDYTDPSQWKYFLLTCTDLNRGYLDRLEQRLARAGLCADVLVDDFESTALPPGCDLLLATLLLEHIHWPSGVAAIARLRPAFAGIILQENPPEMDSAVTPGRMVPPSIERALRSARVTLVPRDELVANLAACAFALQHSFELPVADGKRLVALLFAFQPSANQSSDGSQESTGS